MFDRFKKLMTFTSIIFYLLLLFLISRLYSANQEKKNKIAYLEVQLNITRKVIETNVKNEVANRLITLRQLEYERKHWSETNEQVKKLQQVLANDACSKELLPDTAIKFLRAN
ncbi:hypothetical protein HL273_04660 [Yersinia enterocolitica]|uniref:hypothetical protein n=1 Tax=Yersinia enterocolitica TaxID=630 RepID=UPI00155ACC5F|nr:hypothetical protein [Yersinia enterocolitica]MBX9483963.1 hypothetical protein [Yersinia enterocolitica]NQS93438.1 hypothetical protein [Yersinia enterocolitica]NQT42578.1 hypothetical protein [Yersinia enterocolitica]NQT99915.1 hypothetical protein [Yersinia enterocolitica]HDM8444792.1 hypothetical protein [Yersinia enterocolitica]